jgi:hypothetical protein
MMSACYRCSCTATSVVHAALPHKFTTLRLCRKIKTEKPRLDTPPSFDMCDTLDTLLVVEEHGLRTSH